MTRKFGAIISVIAIIFLAYLLLLCFPQPFFKDSIRYRNLTLYSDRPFDMESGLRLLAMAQDKLGDSPFYLPSEEHTIFICNERWRQILFFNRNYRVGGVNYFPLTRNVFLRDSIIEENRLRGPGGKLVDGDRTLDYFIAHEIAHTLTGEAVEACVITGSPNGFGKAMPITSGRGNPSITMRHSRHSSIKLRK
ncbi:MAG: hypothetical protein IPL01_14815 [Acidobacteria bacterium]|nr:hypothetical protein [Acidobacteriota bacterium]